MTVDTKEDFDAMELLINELGTELAGQNTQVHC